MVRSTDSRRARNSDSVMISGRRRPVSRPSRRRCFLASSLVDPLTDRTSSSGRSARGRGRRCPAGHRRPGQRPGRRPNRGGAYGGAGVLPRLGVPPVRGVGVVVAVLRRGVLRRSVIGALSGAAGLRVGGVLGRAGPPAARARRARWVSGWSWARLGVLGPPASSASWAAGASSASAPASESADLARLRLGLRLRRRPGRLHRHRRCRRRAPRRSPARPTGTNRPCRIGPRESRPGRIRPRRIRLGRIGRLAAGAGSGARRRRLEHHLRWLEHSRWHARRGRAQFPGTAPSSGVVIVFSVVQLALEHSGNLQSGSRARESAALPPEGGVPRRARAPRGSTLSAKAQAEPQWRPRSRAVPARDRQH